MSQIIPDDIRRINRLATLYDVLHEINELYFTADNDIEEAQCNGITKAHEAVEAMIERENP